MNVYEKSLNKTLTDTFNHILKYEEESLRTLSSIPVTVTEAHMMEAIAKLSNSATVSDIASALNVALPTVTVAVKKLIQKDLVTKVQCSKDARKAIVSLTVLGKKIERGHAFFHRKMVKSMSAELSEEQREILLSSITKINKLFKEKMVL